MKITKKLIVEMIEQELQETPVSLEENIAALLGAAATGNEYADILRSVLKHDVGDGDQSEKQQALMDVFGPEIAEKLIAALSKG